MKQNYYFLNNIKMVLTVIVVLVHIAVTYGSAGGWFYYEHGSGELTKVLLTTFTAIQQAYFMGFFFFISGIFVPSSYEKRSSKDFIKRKCIRLGIPLIIFTWIISPVMYIMHAKIINQDTRPWMTLLSASEGQCFSNGPLWFVQALLIFNLCYAVLKAFNNNKTNTIPKVFPQNRTIFLSITAIGILTFFIRIIFPSGSQVIGFQLGNFPIYIMLFIAGLYVIERKWLQDITKERVAFWWRFSLIGIAVLPIIIILGKDVELFMGGWNIQALVYALWEPLIAIGIMLKYIDVFRERFNVPTEISLYLTRNAYSVYIIHAPIIVMLSFLIKDLEIPPIVKFFIVSIVGVPLCFVSGNLIRKIANARKILG